jgi:N-acetylglucosamine-6-sulfatase
MLPSAHPHRNTLYIVFTSDNGWAMGEHRRQFGKWSAYEEDMRVPLIVRGPSVPEGVERKHMVLNNDFAPTFAELSGAETPSFVDGRSLVPLLSADPPSSTNWRSAFLVEWYGYEGYEEDLTANYEGVPPYRAIRTKDRLWVEYPSGEQELYDLREDPDELTSLHEPAPDDLKEELSSKLDKLRNCSREGCRKAEGF